MPLLYISLQFILNSTVLQSGLSWTAEEGAPPVTRDIPDVARTRQAKWPECSCHVKYASGLSKQCVQYSEGRKPGGGLIFLGVSDTLGVKSDLIFLPHTGWTCSVCHNLWGRDFKKCCIKVCRAFMLSWVAIGVFVWVSAVHCCRDQKSYFSRMQQNRCIHRPGGHLFWRPQMRCMHAQRHAVLLIMLEWWLRGTRPPRSCSPMSHIYVLPWQLVRNKALKQQEAWGHRREPNCPTRHAIPMPGAVDSVRRGWEATWSSIMNLGGLVLPLATGAKTVHPGS